MISQLLYGDLYEVIEKKEKWVLIKINFDDYKGWIDYKQFSEIESENHFNELIKNKAYSLDLINFVETYNKELIPILLGSNIGVSEYIKHTFDGEFSNKIRNRKQLIETAKLYLNAPYLWGGKLLLELIVQVYLKWFIKLMAIKFQGMLKIKLILEQT